MEFQKVLITGGSRGIGRALVERYAKSSVEVHAVSRNPSQFGNPENVRHHSFDLSSIANTRDFGEFFLAKFGVPDLVINNAGRGAFYSLASFPESEIVNQINLLFLTPILLAKTFAPEMKKKGMGTIVNLSSLATLYPLPFMPLYNAGKSALSSFTETMILEFPDYPKFIDFKMGDVRSQFNDHAAKNPCEEWDGRMKNAWIQIENQLRSSPSPQVAARQISEVVDCDKSGVFYGGGWFQSKAATLGHRLLSKKFLIILLRSLYKI